MHIAVDAVNVLHDRRGIGRYARALLRRYAAPGVDDVRVTLLVPGSWPSLARPKLAKALGLADVTVRSRKDVVVANPDLVWYPWNGMTWFSPLASIATIHDVWPFASPATDLRRRRNEQTPFRASAARAAAIVTDSSFSKAEITKYLDVTGDRVHVIPLGVDPQTAPQAGAGSALLLDGASRYVLFVGENEPRKDLATLLAAMARLPDQLQMTTGLVIAGKPGPALGARGRIAPARQRGQRTHVLTFGRHESVPQLVTGEISDALLSQLYAGAAVLAFPSRYEGFGLPVVEAMARGVPVVAADAASIPEVAGDAALYFAPGDSGGLAGALSRVMFDVALAAQLRAAGLARATALTWDRCAAQTLALFREVAAKC